MRTYGDGLSHSVCQRPCYFSIDFINVPVDRTFYGNLLIELKGPANVEIKGEINEMNVYEFEYYPTISGSYTLNITFNDKHITGSPFSVHIS